LKKFIIKLGTGILSAGKGNIRTRQNGELAESMAKCRNLGTEFIIVSSGAVGLGMGKLGFGKAKRLSSC
jgi:glutamate 5-kinase